MWRATAAARCSRLISLTIAAITTLIVPVAVRRMIDFGFTPEGIAMINSYFSVMIAVVAVLALRQRVALLSGDDASASASSPISGATCSRI